MVCFKVFTPQKTFVWPLYRASVKKLMCLRKFRALTLVSEAAHTGGNCQHQSLINRKSVARWLCMLFHIIMCARSRLAAKSRARLSQNKHHKQTRIWWIFMASEQCRELRHEVIPRAALYLNQTRGKGPEKCCLNAQQSRQGGSFPCMRTSSASIKRARWHTQVVFFFTFPYIAPN
jgi:hypothetical protein